MGYDLQILQITEEQNIKDKLCLTPSFFVFIDNESVQIKLLSRNSCSNVKLRHVWDLRLRKKSHFCFIDTKTSCLLSEIIIFNF